MPELVSGKYFRVNTITKLKDVDPLSFEVQPLSEGLAIEKKCKDYDKTSSYYVVAFIKPHIYKKNPRDTEIVCFADMNCGVDLEDVGFRSIDMLDEKMSIEDFWEMMQEYKNCVEFAKSAMLDAIGE